MSYNTKSSQLIGTTSAVILSATQNRRYGLITNNSDKADLYLGIGTGAVLGGGITVSGFGSTYEITKINPCGAFITAVSGGTESITVGILEY